MNSLEESTVITIDLSDDEYALLVNGLRDYEGQLRHEALGEDPERESCLTKGAEVAAELVMKIETAVDRSLAERSDPTYMAS